MQQCGIYEQLITQLLTSRLGHELFYVGGHTLARSSTKHKAPLNMSVRMPFE